MELLKLIYRIAGKFGEENVWEIEFTLIKRLTVKSVWRMNRSAKGLFIETTNLDGFSLVNRRCKFTKLSTCQIILLYGTMLQKLLN